MARSIELQCSFMDLNINLSHREKLQRFQAYLYFLRFPIDIIERNGWSAARYKPIKQQ